MDICREVKLNFTNEISLVSEILIKKEIKIQNLCELFYFWDCYVSSGSEMYFLNLPERKIYFFHLFSSHFYAMDSNFQQPKYFKEIFKNLIKDKSEVISPHLLIKKECWCNINVLFENVQKKHIRVIDDFISFSKSNHIPLTLESVSNLWWIITLSKEKNKKIYSSFSKKKGNSPALSSKGENSPESSPKGEYSPSRNSTISITPLFFCNYSTLSGEINYYFILDTKLKSYDLKLSLNIEEMKSLSILSFKEK